MAREGGRAAGPARRWPSATRSGTTRSTAPFIRGLAYSEATFFVNETAQREVFMDMVDRIVFKSQPVPESVAQAAAEEQKLLDAFFK